jgi:hypothetical protein
MELDVHGLRIGSWTSPLGLLLLLYLPTYLPAQVEQTSRYTIRHLRWSRRY